MPSSSQKGIEQGLAKGMEQGFEKGATEKEKEIIRNMYKKGIASQEIAELCGVSLETVSAAILQLSKNNE